MSFVCPEVGAFAITEFTQLLVCVWHFVGQQCVNWYQGYL